MKLCWRQLKDTKNTYQRKTFDVIRTTFTIVQLYFVDTCMFMCMLVIQHATQRNTLTSHPIVTPPPSFDFPNSNINEKDLRFTLLKQFILNICATFFFGEGILRQSQIEQLSDICSSMQFLLLILFQGFLFRNFLSVISCNLTFHLFLIIPCSMLARKPCLDYSFITILGHIIMLL